MTGEWEARIEVYACSTGAGQEQDSEACGGRVHTFAFAARDAADALSRATLISVGMKANPRVWQANIVKLEAK